MLMMQFFIDDDILTNVFYGKKSGSSATADLTFNWAKNVESPKGRVNSIYPNPATSGISFGLHLDQAATVKIGVSDFQGNSLSHEYQYSAGDHTYSFANISSLSPGPLNYTVKMDNFTYSGIVIKSPN